MKPKIPVTESQAYWREMAASGDRNLVDIQATGIERTIPPDSLHEDAIKALHLCKQARRFGATDKGFLFLKQAESARKDFELYDGYAAKAKANAAARAAAKKPRKKDPLRAKILGAMQSSSHESFETFMSRWAIEPIAGLHLQADAATTNFPLDKTKHLVSDWDGELGSRLYTWGSLKKLYSS